MILTKEKLLKMQNFETLVKKEMKSAYPDLNPLTRERFEREMDWIRIQHLEEGFLEMWNIVEEARTSLEATVGTARRGLENSMVAYSLGFTDKDPLPANGLPAFPFPDPMLPLNVGVSIDSENRNRLVKMAEAVYGRSMMRAGLPILRLDGIILEFFRC